MLTDYVLTNWPLHTQEIREPLQLVQLLTAFQLYGIGMGMAVIVFVMEKTVHNLNVIKDTPGVSGRLARVSVW